MCRSLKKGIWFENSNLRFKIFKLMHKWFGSMQKFVQVDDSVIDKSTSDWYSIDGKCVSD